MGNGTNWTSNDLKGKNIARVDGVYKVLGATGGLSAVSSRKARQPKVKDAATIPVAKAKSEGYNFLEWAIMAAKLTYTSEYRFCERMWRFDFAIFGDNGGIVAALEYEGIFSEKSRHTNLKGYVGDIQKYNRAALMGITVLRYTAANYKEIIDDLKTLFKDKAA